MAGLAKTVEILGRGSKSIPAREWNWQTCAGLRSIVTARSHRLMLSSPSLIISRFDSFLHLTGHITAIDFSFFWRFDVFNGRFPDFQNGTRWPTKSLWHTRFCRVLLFALLAGSCRAAVGGVAVYSPFLFSLSLPFCIPWHYKATIPPSLPRFFHLPLSRSLRASQSVFTFEFFSRLLSFLPGSLSLWNWRIVFFLWQKEITTAALTRAPKPR